MKKSLRERVVYPVVALLLALLAGQAVLSMRTKSPTADELAHHVASGYSYLVTKDFRMNPASPPLPRMLAGFPLLFLGAKAPLDHPSWKEGNSPEFAQQFFYVYNKDADRLIFWARVPIVVLSVIFGFFVFWWGRKLFGEWAGLAALFLYAFCPDIIAHSGLATADLAVALFFFLALFSFWAYLRAPSFARLGMTGVLAGLAFLSKFSAILLLPILLITGLLSGKAKCITPARTAAFLCMMFFTIWAGYFFELKPLLKNTPDPLKKEAVYRRIGGEVLVRFAKEVPVPLSTFFSAIVSMSYTRAQGTNAFLLGQWSREGWWYYYFVAFLIKNTIPFILIALISLFFIRKLGLDKMTVLVLLAPIIFFFILTLRDKAQAGIRYFLPIYPLLFMLSGGMAVYLWSKGKVLRCLVCMLALWHAAEALVIFPDYFSYFNGFIGGPRNGYKYLRDSNLDWGQDLKGLATWVREQGSPEVALFYPWPASPDYYAIPHRELTQEEWEKPDHAIYAISAHRIDRVLWTKEFSASKVIGHSIFVYDFREKGASRA